MKRTLYLFMAAMLCSAECSFAADVPLMTPVDERITDEAISSDIRVINSLQKRLANINSGGTPIGTYHFAKAQAWIDMAMDEYVMNDRTAVIEDTVRVAHELILQLEERKSGISMETSILPTSKKIRADLWQKAADWKKHAGFPCGEDLVAQLEVQLVWAGHEDNQLGWRHAKPYLQAAERLAKEAGRKIESCPESERVKVAMGIPVEASSAKATPAPAVPVEEPVAAKVKEAPTQAPLCTPCATCPECPPPATIQSAKAQPPSTVSTADGGTVSDRIHFALNRDIISPRSAAVLQRVAAVMNENRAITVELRGHADERGHRVFNNVLSRHRAEVVRTYLVSSGIERSRIKVSASGSGSPEKRGSDILSYARNRRVEFVFSGSDVIKTTPQYEDVQVEKVRQ